VLGVDENHVIVNITKSKDEEVVRLVVLREWRSLVLTVLAFRSSGCKIYLLEVNYYVILGNYELTRIRDVEPTICMRRIRTE